MNDVFNVRVKNEDGDMPQNLSITLRKNVSAWANPIIVKAGYERRHTLNPLHDHTPVISRPKIGHPVTTYDNISKAGSVESGAEAADREEEGQIEMSMKVNDARLVLPEPNTLHFVSSPRAAYL
uniref:Uncharacterized protein n=1 Tax=Setaria digitata TaxID=48799 RepID=A0A915PCG7_9BILA